MEKKTALSKLSACLLKSYASVALNLDSESHDFSSTSVNIIYQQVTGLAIDCTDSFHNTVIMDIQCSYLNGTEIFHSIDFRRTDLIVAMFESSLELPNPTQHYSTIEINKSDESCSINAVSSLSVEKKFLLSLAAMIQRSKVDLVCCQQRIHPFLKRKLLTMGIRTLSNISVRYMGALLRLSVLVYCLAL